MGSLRRPFITAGTLRFGCNAWSFWTATGTLRHDGCFAHRAKGGKAKRCHVDKNARNPARYVVRSYNDGLPTSRPMRQ